MQKNCSGILGKQDTTRGSTQRAVKTALGIKMLLCKKTRGTKQNSITGRKA